YNQYDDVRSIDLITSPRPSATFANDQSAQSWGFEFSGNFQVKEWWRLRGGYTYLGKSFQFESVRVFPGSDTFEADDPHNQAQIQSFMDLPGHFHLDIVGRYVDKLTATLVTPRIPAYVTFDTRFSRQFKYFEIAIVGQNLSEDNHLEFGSPGSSREIPRSVYGKITFRR